MANGFFMGNSQNDFCGIFFIARRLSMSRLRVSLIHLKWFGALGVSIENSILCESIPVFRRIYFFRLSRRAVDTVVVVVCVCAATARIPSANSKRNDEIWNRCSLLICCYPLICCTHTLFERYAYGVANLQPSYVPSGSSNSLIFRIFFSFSLFFVE